MIIERYGELLEQWDAARKAHHTAKIFGTEEEVRACENAITECETALSIYVEEAASDLLFCIKHATRINPNVLKTLILDLLGLGDIRGEIVRLVDAIADLEVKHEQLARHHEFTRRGPQASQTTSRQSAEIPIRSIAPTNAGT